MKEELKKGFTISLLLLLSNSSALYSQEKKIPELTTNPDVIGKKVAENIVSRRFGWRYQKVCSYYGALIFADVSGNKEIARKVDEGFAPYHAGKKKYKKVNSNMFACGPTPKRGKAIICVDLVSQAITMVRLHFYGLPLP